MISRFVISSFILTTSLALTHQAASAEAVFSRPYYFSGPCTSQGKWTQEALANTQRLREFTMQFKDNPACKGLGNSLRSYMDKMDENLKSVDKIGDAGTRLSTLPHEISALRNFAVENSGYRNQVLNIMMSKAIEHSTLSASVQKDFTSSQVASSDANALSSFGKRIARSTKNGLDMFNNVVDEIPRMEECLDSKGSVAMGQFLAGSIQLLSSFASSGQDNMGGSLARSVSKISDVFGREKKYYEALRELNRAELRSSLQCILEVTSEAYCSARDGMMLFQKMVKDLNVRYTGEMTSERVQDRFGSGRKIDNPLTGYYLLNQHIPVITEWIQKVQIGVTPQLPTDAEFQINVIDDVMTFVKKMKVAQGDLNKNISTIRSFKDLKTKQNGIIDLIEDLVHSLDYNSNGKNFFTMSTQPIEIPFRLLGMEIPPQVAPKEGGYPMKWDQWLQINYRSLPSFQNPDKLAEAIRANLQSIFDEAEKAALDYYNQWFIVDKIGLVNNSLNGVIFNVRTSLMAVNEYLEGLDLRVRRYGKDMSLLPSIEDTRERINKILSRYAELEAFGAELKRGRTKLSKEELQKKTALLSINIIQKAYDQFEVLLARSGWLANRMSTFVQSDYIMLLKAKVDFSPYHEELFYATGMAAIDQMISMGSSGHTKVEADLHMALNTNQTNLVALERVLKDLMVSQVAELKLVSDVTKQRKNSLDIDEGSISNFQIWWDSHKRSFVDHYIDMPGKNSLMPVKVVRSVWGSFVDLTFLNDKYPLPGIWGKSKHVNIDNEFGSSKYLYSQFCIQSLAFRDIRPFWNLCKDVVFASSYKVGQGGDNRIKSDYLSIGFSAKAREDLGTDRALNFSKRVCAFRDYHRRNLVYYLTSGMK